jgi:hypothetical protein
MFADPVKTGAASLAISTKYEFEPASGRPAAAGKAPAVTGTVVKPMTPINAKTATRMSSSIV